MTLNDTESLVVSSIARIDSLFLHRLTQFFDSIAGDVSKRITLRVIKSSQLPRTQFSRKIDSGFRQLRNGTLIVEG